MSFNEFFFADTYRIIVIIILFLAIISFGIFIYLVYSRKNSSFNIIFKIMLNVMISAILSGIGYIFNWKNGTNEKLIFGDGIMCTMQSVFLGLFQTSRESFLASLSFLIFLNYKNPNINIDKYKRLFTIMIYLFGYGIPLIANIIYISIGGYGKSHLFCFTKENDDKSDSNGDIIGIIHYIYIIILVILNFYFTFYVISHEVCCKKKENDLWEEEDNISCFNPLLKRLIFYPFAQIISLSGPIYYRIMTYFVDEGGNTNGAKLKLIEGYAGICAILNCLSTFLHTFIFALSNNLLNCNKKEEKIEENKNSLFNNDKDD
jgi:hypothetical protein